MIINKSGLFDKDMRPLWVLLVKGRVAVTGEVERKWRKPVVECYSGRPEGPTELRTSPWQPTLLAEIWTKHLPTAQYYHLLGFDISFENMFPNLVEFGTFSTLKVLEHCSSDRGESSNQNTCFKNRQVPVSPTLPLPLSLNANKDTGAIDPSTQDVRLFVQ